MIQEEIARKVEDFLNADPEGYRLFTHPGADYCYFFRSQDVGTGGTAFEVSPLEALQMGWITLRDGKDQDGRVDGTVAVDLPCGVFVPLEINWTKVRRRVEDALRKLADNSKLYKVARELGIKLS